MDHNIFFQQFESWFQQENENIGFHGQMVHLRLGLMAFSLKQIEHRAAFHTDRTSENLQEIELKLLK